MTNPQFHSLADQVANSKASLEDKTIRLAGLLKKAYEQDLELPILYSGTPDQARHAYMLLDDAHPRAIGNRGLLCYTSKKFADNDFFYGHKDNLRWGYVSIQFVLNNLFNKAAIGVLLFNAHDLSHAIAVPKEILEQMMPGEHPLPMGFKDIPTEGWPVPPTMK